MRHRCPKSAPFLALSIKLKGKKGRKEGKKQAATNRIVCGNCASETPIVADDCSFICGCAPFHPPREGMGSVSALHPAPQVTVVAGHTRSRGEQKKKKNTRRIGIERHSLHSSHPSVGEVYDPLPERRSKGFWKVVWNREQAKQASKQQKLLTQPCGHKLCRKEKGETSARMKDCWGLSSFSQKDCFSLFAGGKGEIAK